jgi:hypothetical protein
MSRKTIRKTNQYFNMIKISDIPIEGEGHFLLNFFTARCARVAENAELIFFSLSADPPKIQADRKGRK